MHKSAGAIIKNGEGKVLMLDRQNFPFGWACPAGHIEDNETPEQAVAREVFEETNLKVEEYNLLIHEFVVWNECKRGGKGHDWFLFEITKWSGEIKQNHESKNLQWLSIEEIKEKQLEEVWKYWLEKLKII